MLATAAGPPASSMTPLRKTALLSIATSVATLALKFCAWFLTGSVSLLSDALEAFVNLAAGLVAFGALTVAEQPADDRHSYGHDKAEYFSSGVEGVLILVAAASIIVAAVDRFLHPTELAHLGPGLLVALLAAAMNFATSRIMLKVAHEHDSITIEADARHLMTDVWTSAGVLAGLCVILLEPRWGWLDPAVAVAVGIHIIFTGVELLKRTVDGLMDAALSPEDIAQCMEAIRGELPLGSDFHDLRTRKAGPQRFIEFHLVVPGRTTVDDSHALCDRIEAAINARLARASVTIHVEPAETESPAAATR